MRSEVLAIKKVKGSDQNQLRRKKGGTRQSKRKGCKLKGPGKEEVQGLNRPAMYRQRSRAGRVARRGFSNKGRKFDTYDGEVRSARGYDSTAPKKGKNAALPRPRKNGSTKGQRGGGKKDGVTSSDRGREKLRLVQKTPADRNGRK